jgi:hypothetical protein
MIAPATDAGPTLWINPQAPGRAPSNTDGTSAQIRAARHVWEEDVQTYRTYTSVQQALKKQIINAFEPMYLDVLNDNMVGFTNISARDMLDHLFSTATSPPLIWKSTLNTCAEHGTPNNLLNPCSSRFKIVQIILRQAVFSLDTHSKSMLATPKYFELNVECFNCGKKGHYSTDCSLPRKNDNEQSSMVSKSDFRNLFQSSLKEMLTKKDKQAKKKENTEGDDDSLDMNVFEKLMEGMHYTG